MMAVLLSCCSYLLRPHCSISHVSLACWNRHHCLARRRLPLRVLACDWLIEAQWQPLAAAAVAVVRKDNSGRESNADVDEHRGDGEVNDDVELVLALEPELRQSSGDCATESHRVSLLLLSTRTTSDWYGWLRPRKYHCRPNHHVEKDADESDGDDDGDDRWA